MAIGRASGLSVCTITRPGCAPRPLRPPTWTSIAKVRSSARKSGKVQREIGIDHPDQRHLGEVVALGDHLRADEDLGAGLREAVEHRAQPPVRGGDVGVEAQQLDAGQEPTTSRSRRSVPNP